MSADGARHSLLAPQISKYVPPAPDRAITNWFAIGDSFSAGVSADTPDDLKNGACNRFKGSYPYQINDDSRLPGSIASRKFAFASCSDPKTNVRKQIDMLLPNTDANFPKVEKPQFGTLSLYWDDIGLANIWNSCIYQWVGSGTDCATALDVAYSIINGTRLVDRTKSTFDDTVRDDLKLILSKGRTDNPSFQLYVTGFVRPWNVDNKQRDTANWARPYKTPTYLSTTNRRAMNMLLETLNDNIMAITTNLSAEVSGGLYFVGDFEEKFNGHRLCEEESDPAYHMKPTADRTWIMHHESPYGSSFPMKEGNFFDVVDSILIPDKAGKSTAEQIKAVNANLSALNPAYDSIVSMTAALDQLAQTDAKYEALPIVWARMMHLKSPGYKEFSNGIVDRVLSNVGVADLHYPQGLKCTGPESEKLVVRDKLSQAINEFCKTAAQQKQHDQNSGSITRTYFSGDWSEVRLGMDWPQRFDITENMESNCVNNMTIIMDDCDGNDPNNPFNWKRGGQLGAGWVNYHIVPLNDHYTPGTCSIHLQQNDESYGYNGLGHSEAHIYSFEQIKIRDRTGKVIGTSGFSSDGSGAPTQADNDYPYVVYSAQNSVLIMTPEAKNDYVQFALGAQMWNSSEPTATAGCDTGRWVTGKPRDKWNTNFRVIDCHFLC
ncbi:SGNH hydrolase-type esterase domain-containing protein [Xylaria arbuscula]|nr:SGNH hydrolase-type esterase domain-containing protein [Xylaria arbuscula]